MINWEDDKPFIIGAVALVGVGGLFLLGKKDDGTTANISGTSDPVYKNDTIFIPTNEYNIQYVNGNQTIENTDNRSWLDVGDNSQVNQPNIPKETVTIPTPQAPTKETLQQPNKTVYAGVTPTNAYSEKSKTSKVMTTYKKGDQIRVIFLGGDWYAGIFNNKQVYFHEDEVVGSDPLKTTTPKQTTTKPATTVVNYTIKKGDTLWGITEKLTGSATMEKVNQIAKDNNIKNPNLIYANDTIKVQIPATTPKQTTTTTNKTTTTTTKKTTTKTHTVVKGETLTSIAKKYGTTVNKIATENSIKNVNLITVGQKLKITI